MDANWGYLNILPIYDCACSYILLHVCMCCVICCPMCHVQSSNLTICSLEEGLKKKLRKFRFRKETNNAAIVSECSPFCRCNSVQLAMMDRRVPLY